MLTQEQNLFAKIGCFSQSIKAEDVLECAGVTSALLPLLKREDLLDCALLRSFGPKLLTSELVAIGASPSAVRALVDSPLFSKEERIAGTVELPSPAPKPAPAAAPLLKPVPKTPSPPAPAKAPSGERGVWLKALLPGRDIARDKDVSGNNLPQALTFRAAAQMKNLIYLVGCKASRECYVVDACWDVAGIARVASENGYKLVGSIATHYHFDHCGGFLQEPYLAMILGPFAGKVNVADGARPRLAGIYDMHADHGCKAYAHSEDVATLVKQTGMETSDLIAVEHGQKLPLGTSGSLTILHTKGHSPGSICITVQAHGDTAPTAVISGDTLFPGSCGRLDCKDSSVEAMFDSLAKLRALPEDVKVYPGHAYSGEQSTIGREKAQGLLRPFTRQMFMLQFGGR